MSPRPMGEGRQSFDEARWIDRRPEICLLEQAHHNKTAQPARSARNKRIQSSTIIVVARLNRGGKLFDEARCTEFLQLFPVTESVLCADVIVGTPGKC